jgi:hypothetical protein
MIIAIIQLAPFCAFYKPDDDDDDAIKLKHVAVLPK